LVGEAALMGKRMIDVAFTYSPPTINPPGLGGSRTVWRHMPQVPSVGETVHLAMSRAHEPLSNDFEAFRVNSVVWAQDRSNNDEWYATLYLV
jgi:hypothetical protein